MALTNERSADEGSRGLPLLIVEHRKALLALAERRGLCNVRVFGSMARGDHDAHSDVDLLVDAPPGTSALALCGLSIDAEALLHRAVDVVTEGFRYPLDTRTCYPGSSTSVSHSDGDEISL